MFLKDFYGSMIPVQLVICCSNCFCCLKQVETTVVSVPVKPHGLGNTRARRTNTAKGAPNMLMHHGHV